MNRTSSCGRQVKVQGRVVSILESNLDVQQKQIIIVNWRGGIKGRWTNCISLHKKVSHVNFPFLNFTQNKH